MHTRARKIKQAWKKVSYASYFRSRTHEHRGRRKKKEKRLGERTQRGGKFFPRESFEFFKTPENLVFLFETLMGYGKMVSRQDTSRWTITSSFIILLPELNLISMRLAEGTRIENFTPTFSGRKEKIWIRQKLYTSNSLRFILISTKNRALKFLGYELLCLKLNSASFFLSRQDFRRYFNLRRSCWARWVKYYVDTLVF